MPLTIKTDVDDKGNVKLRNMKKNVTAIDKMASTLGATFTGVFGAQALQAMLSKGIELTKKFVAQIGQVARAGDDFDKMSKRVGESVEFLSQFGHAAQLAGTDISALEPSFKKAQKAIVDADRGILTYKRSFDELGISVRNTDGSLISTQELLLQAAEKFQGLSSHTHKAALAQELFGRGGLSMIPILDQGTDAIKAQMNEAEKLGISWDTLSSQKAAAYIDAMTRLQGVFKGIQRDSILPILEGLVPVLEELAKRAKPMGEAFKIIGKHLGELIIMDYGQLSKLEFIINGVTKSVMLAGNAFISLTTSIKLAFIALTAWQQLKRGQFKTALDYFTSLDDILKQGKKTIEEFSLKMVEAAQIPFTGEAYSKTKKKKKKGGGGGDDDSGILGAAKTLPSDYFAFIKAIEEVEIQALQEAEDRELARLQAWYDEKLTLYRKFIEDDTTLTEVYQKKKREIEKKYEEQRRREALQTRAIHTRAVGDVIGAIGDMADAVGASAETLKKIRSFEVVVNTAAAIMSVWASPFGDFFTKAAQAFAVGLRGTAQLAKINSARYARGTDYSGEGLAQVGEQGPEMVQLPEGSKVFNNYETRRMQDAVNFGSEGAREVHFHIGTIIGEDNYVRDNILPLMQEEASRI